LLREKANGHCTPGEQCELHILRRSLRGVHVLHGFGPPGTSVKVGKKTHKPISNQHPLFKSHEEAHLAFPSIAANFTG